MSAITHFDLSRFFRPTINKDGDGKITEQASLFSLNNIRNCEYFRKRIAEFPFFLVSPSMESTEQDLCAHVKKVMRIVTYKIPDASGFGLGFMFGLKH